MIDTNEDFDACFTEGTEALSRCVTAAPRSILVLEGREAVNEAVEPLQDDNKA